MNWASTMQRVDSLKDVQLFSGLSFESLVRLAQSSQTQAVPAGEPVFRQGSQGEALYVILEGQAQVLLEPDKLLGDLGPQDVFGEMAVFDEESRPRSATVRAVTPLLLLRLSRGRFREVLSYYPEVGINLLRLLAERVRAKDRGPR